jgi:hypothetical protein
MDNGPWSTIYRLIEIRREWMGVEPTAARNATRRRF